jgi:hypothetical protein
MREDVALHSPLWSIKVYAASACARLRDTHEFDDDVLEYAKHIVDAVPTLPPSTIREQLVSTLIVDSGTLAVCAFVNCLMILIACGIYVETATEKRDAMRAILELIWAIEKVEDDDIERDIINVDAHLHSAEHGLQESFHALPGGVDDAVDTAIWAYTSLVAKPLTVASVGGLSIMAAARTFDSMREYKNRIVQMMQVQYDILERIDSFLSRPTYVPLKFTVPVALFDVFGWASALSDCGLDGEATLHISSIERGRNVLFTLSTT